VSIKNFQLALPELSAIDAVSNLLTNDWTLAMYKMEINASGQQRIFLFRGPGCRKEMSEW